MQERPRRRDNERHGKRKVSTARRIFGQMAEAGAAAYVRSRDLPKLIPLWPHELGDHSPEGCRGCWRSFGARSGPSGGARSQAIGAMTSIGILA